MITAHIPNALPPAIWLVAVLVSAPHCWGQSPPENSLEIVEPGSVAEGPRIVRIVRFVVSPAPAPVPKLRHRFTVPPHRTIAGNAATAYMRSFGEQGFHGPLKRATDQFGQDRFYELVSEGSLNDIPLEEIRGASEMFDDYVNAYISPATRCRDCDWGMGVETLPGDEFLVFRLPFMQESRSIARVLSLQTRCAVKEGDYEKAISRLQMTYQLGHRIGKAKILVCCLISIADSSIATSSLMDLIAAPNSPNMYWALGSIPDPGTDFQAALQLDLSLGPRILDIDEIEKQKYSDEEWNRRLREVSVRLLKGIGNGDPVEEPTLAESLAATGTVMTRYRDAKKRLRASGMEPERVEQMSVGQVVLIDATREYQRFSDEVEAITYLPWPEAKQRLSQFDQLYVVQGPPSLGNMMAQQIMPASGAMYRAVIRMRRQIAVLRVIEAIRMHAAATGSLPATLDDINIVYVPNNPATEKPFLYRVEGNKAIIDLPLSDDANSIAERFEVSLAK